jgi:hypothetical protein
LFDLDSVCAPHRAEEEIIEATPRAKGAEVKRTRAVPALGMIFLVQLAGVYALDWWFHFEPGDYSMRFWPHVVRGAFVLQIVGYIALHARQLKNLRIARFQFLWLGILTLRFLYSGNFDSQVVLYMSYYAYWVLVLWAGYCLVVDGHLSTRQVATAGALMIALMVIRNALWTFAGVWIGVLGVGWRPEEEVTNSAYAILWFTLMLMLDISLPLGKPIALLGVMSVVLSVKRGAFIALLLAGIAYGITYAYIHRKGRGIKRVAAIAVLVAVAIGVSVWARSDEISERWSDVNDPSAIGGGSGREVFWAIIGQEWLGDDLTTKLIGNGPHSVYELTGELWFAEIPAHNDWLNLVYEFGIIGVLAFAGVCWALARSVPLLMRDCVKMAPVFTAALAAAFCVSIFDLFSYNTETSFFALLMAVPLGMSARAHATGIE